VDAVPDGEEDAAQKLEKVCYNEADEFGKVGELVSLIVSPLVSP